MKNLVTKSAAKRGLAELKKNGGKMLQGWWHPREVDRLKEYPIRALLPTLKTE